MISLPVLTELNIRAITDSRSFERGERYFKERRVEEPQRQGRKLRAKVLGSQYYYCEVTLQEAGIASTYCTCPLGGGCKHIVALLLTWFNHSESFDNLAEPQLLLQQRDREDLIELIVEMVDRHPDLEALLYLPIPRKAPQIERAAAEFITNDTAQNMLNTTDPTLVATTTNTTQTMFVTNNPSFGTFSPAQTIPSFSTPAPVTPVDATAVDPTMIRRQLRSARAYGYLEYSGNGGANFYKIHKICDWGDKYAAVANWHNAVLVYATILDELLEQPDEYSNHEGELPGYEGCVDGLQTALAFVSDPAMRQQILQTLLRAWLWDVKQGGLGVGDAISETILAGASSQEKKIMAGWLQNEVKQEVESTASVPWRHPIYGAFLLALHGHEVDDETYLRICRQTGLTTALLDRLLCLHRIEEAIAVACQVNDHDIIPLADIYVRHEQGILAVRLLEERVRNKPTSDLLAWLKNYFVTESNPQRAFEYAYQLFRQNPSVDGYLEIQALANDEAHWQQVRNELEQWLQSENRWELLARTHLKNGEIDKAIQAIRSGEEHHHQLKDYWYAEHLRTARLAVAAATEEHNPNFAIESYLRMAERAIAEQNRHSYAIAAQYLQGVRRAYQRQGDTKGWQQVITTLRQQYRSLRLLQEELNKVDL